MDGLTNKVPQNVHGARVSGSRRGDLVPSSFWSILHDVCFSERWNPKDQAASETLVLQNWTDPVLKSQMNETV